MIVKWSLTRPKSDAEDNFFKLFNHEIHQIYSVCIHVGCLFPKRYWLLVIHRRIIITFLQEVIKCRVCYFNSTNTSKTVNTCLYQVLSSLNNVLSSELLFHVCYILLLIIYATEKLSSEIPFLASFFWWYKDFFPRLINIKVGLKSFQLISFTINIISAQELGWFLSESSK